MRCNTDLVVIFLREPCVSSLSLSTVTAAGRCPQSALTYYANFGRGKTHLKPTNPPPPCWASPRARLSGTGTPLRWAYHFIHCTPLTSRRSGHSDVSLDRSGFGRSSLSSLYSYVLVGGACCGASWYLYRLAMGSQGALLAATCDWPSLRETTQSAGRRATLTHT
jgi:hypothetical protein